MIREAGCLVFVVAAFDGTDPVADLRSFDEDLVLADMEIVANRIQRVEDSLKKPLPRLEHQQFEHEHATLKIVLAAMESGQPLRESHMTDEQQKVTRAFRLLSEKPRLVIVNTADDESNPERFSALSTPEMPVMAVPAGLELELSKMTPEDRAEFEQEMGLVGHRPRPPDPHADEDLRADDVFHGRRAGGPHVAVAARRHGPGGGRRHPHRPGPRLHPRRSDDRHRPGPPGQRARDEGPSPHAPGTEGLRRQGRRHSVDSVQRVVAPLALWERAEVRAGLPWPTKNDTVAKSSSVV